MHIVIDARAAQLAHGGIPRYTREVITQLTQATHHNITLLTTGRKKVDLRISTTKKVKHIHFGVPDKILNALLFIGLFPKIDRWIARKTSLPVDVVFMPNMNFVALSKTVPLVLTVHDLSFIHFSKTFSIKTRMWHKLIQPKKLINRAAHIITVSQATAQDVRDEYNTSPHRLHTIHLGAPQTRDRMDKCAKQNRYILALNADQKRKNITCLIHAFRDYIKSTNDPKTTLILTGKKGSTYYTHKKMLCEQSTAGRIKWLQPLSDEEKNNLLQNASVLVYPTLYEGFGIPLLEALSEDIPVITSPHSSVTEVAEQAAIYADPHNIKSLSRALHESLNNATLRQSISTKKDDIIRKYDWKLTGKKTVKTLEAVMHATS